MENLIPIGILLFGLSGAVAAFSDLHTAVLGLSIPVLN
jgi:hypothetical protein